MPLVIQAAGMANGTRDASMNPAAKLATDTMLNKIARILPVSVTVSVAIR